MDPMEEMYESFTEEKPAEGTSNQELVDSLSNFQELDPNFELSVDIQSLLALEGTLNTPEPQELSTPNPLAAHVQQEQLFPIVPDFFSRTTDSPEPQPEQEQRAANDDSAIIVEPMPEPSTIEIIPTSSWVVVKEEPSESQDHSAPPSPSPPAAPGEHNYYTVDDQGLLSEDDSSSVSSYQHKFRGKASPPSRATARRRLCDKNSDEYRERRARNNIAVRKSRDKAKQRQRDTENKVQELLHENERLTKKVDLLTKELSVLKGLFANVGAVLPPEVQKYLAS